MKVTRVRAIASAAPVDDMRGDRRNYVYVHIDTDAGVDGWGEATIGSLAVMAMVDELGAAIVGRDPHRTEDNWQTMYHLYHNVRGGPVHMAAISAIDNACWDIRGKDLGVPVHRLLGGPVREEIWTYGRFDGKTPQAAAEHALSELELGVTALKGDPFVHLGIEPTLAAEQEAIEVVAAVRAAVGDDVELLIEAHGRLSPMSAIRMCQRIAQYRPMFIEEPIAPTDLAGLARVSREGGLPIATGERLYGKWAFLDLLAQGAVDVIQPDPAHAGGITELMKIAAIADAHHVAVAPHNPYGPVNTMAALNISATIPNFLIQEGGLYSWFSEITLAEPPQPRAGFFHVPSGSGLGVELNEQALRKYPPVIEPRPSGYLRGSRIAGNQRVDWA